MKTRRYVSEKIVDAFLAGAVPINMGATPTQIGRFFNPSRFIMARDDEKDFKGTTDRIVALWKNCPQLQKMQREPILAHGDATIKRFICLMQTLIPPPTPNHDFQP